MDYTPGINRFLNSKTLEGKMSTLPNTSTQENTLGIGFWAKQFQNYIDSSVDDDGNTILHTNSALISENSTTTYINLAECYISVLEDVPVIYSFEAKGSGAIQSFLYSPSVVNTDNSVASNSSENVSIGSDGSHSYNLTDDWQRFWIKYAVKKSGRCKIIPVRVRSVNGVDSEVYFRKPKLEYGDSSTDWTEAPEDYLTPVREISSDTITI